MFSPHKFQVRFDEIADLIRQGIDPPSAYKEVYGFYPRGIDTWTWLAKLASDVLSEE